MIKTIPLASQKYKHDRTQMVFRGPIFEKSYDEFTIVNSS